MVLFRHKLNAHTTGQRNHGIILIDGIPNFIQILTVALPLKRHFVDFDLISLFLGMHAQRRSQNAHLFFTPGLTNGDTFVAAQDQNVFVILEVSDDFFNWFSICNNH